MLALCLAPVAVQAEAESPPAVVSSGAVTSAPSAPETSPTPSFFDINKYRADPGNPGAIRVPGTNVAIYIGGFAQLDVISDLNVIGNPDQLVVASIPVGGGTGNTGSELSARQSRVFIETDAPWKVAPLLAYLEVDFFDPQNQADLHIRHAFGAVGHPDGVRFLGGQTWTTFMDATVFPSQLDYAGPVGLVNVQQPQARLIVPIHRRTRPDRAADGAGVAVRDRGAQSPDHRPDGHAGDRLLALARCGLHAALGSRPRPPSPERRVPPTRDPARRRRSYRNARLRRQLHRPPDRFLGQGRIPLVGGRRPRGGALLRRLERTRPRRLPAGGRRCSPRRASSAGWARTSTFCGETGSHSPPSTACCISSTCRPAPTRRSAQSQYVGAVFQYFPNKRFMAGIEYMFGQRENRNGETGSDNRLQVSTQVKF